MRAVALVPLLTSAALACVACASGANRPASEPVTAAPTPANAAEPPPKLRWRPDGSLATSEPEPTEPVPRWIAAASGDAELVNVRFQSTPRTVVVQQYSSADPAKATCRARDDTSTAWYVPAGGCLDPDFSYLNHVDAGPGGLVALHSSAEGHSAVSVARYSVTAGQSPAIVTLLFEGGSAVDVGFAPDGSRVDFVSPCALGSPGVSRCTNPEAAPRWRLYSMPAKGGPLILRRDDLPPGSAFDSTSERFAWPRGTNVCIGDPKEPRPRCTKLPR